MCTCIYTYYLSPHCLGCTCNDVDIFIDDLTNKAHNNNTSKNSNPGTLMCIPIYNRSLNNQI